MITVLPGDVLLVRIRGRAWPVRVSAWLISLGARMRHEPDTWNHVIVADHIDAAGTFWGLQGQPGVVGAVDLAPYLADPETLTNAGQQKSGEQRALIVAAMQPLVGKAGYDWLAILGDAAQAMTATAAQRFVAPLWSMLGKWGPGAPGHVVCSSLADWAYHQAGLDSPDPDRWCTPGDWAQWVERQPWYAP
jgi:hypothetical protein